MDEDLNRLRELRMAVSAARESCAGSSVKEFPVVRTLIGNACKIAKRLRYDLIATRLSAIWLALIDARDYGDRLVPDNLMCGIISEIDIWIKNKEQYCNG